jgi:NADH-quinone oxidoreductase subunit G
MYRYMTRENAELGMYFLCDKGRFDIEWMNENRLFAYYEKGMPSESAKVIPKILDKIQSAKKIAVIGGAHESNENLALIKAQSEKFGKEVVLEARVIKPQYFLPEQVDFLMTTDPHPNTKGTFDLAFNSQGGIDSIVKDFNDGKIDLLFILKEDIPANLKGPGTIVVLHTNITASVKDADFAVPIKTFAEQSGTFTNKNGIKQSFELAIQPLQGLPSSGDFFKRLNLELSMKKEE